MNRNMLRYDMVKLICGFSVLLLLLLLCESAQAISLQYKLAMLGYGDKEITDIISKRQTLRAINSNYKKRILGYPTESRSSVTFSTENKERAFPQDRLPNPYFKEPIFTRQTRSQPVSEKQSVG